MKMVFILIKWLSNFANIKHMKRCDFKVKFANYLLGKQWFMSIVRQRFLDAVNDMDINTHAFGSGLEDRGITDRYRAMEFGIEHTIEKVVEAIETVA